MAKKRKVKKFVVTKLNEKERTQWAKDAAELNVEYQKAKLDFSVVKKEWSEKLKEFDKELSRKLEAVRTGDVEQELECDVEYGASSVKFIYKGKVVEERPITEDEAQMDIDEAVN